MTCDHELELDNLRRAITREREFDPKLQLWKGEARMLALLYKRPGVRMEALCAVTGSEPESVRVQLSRLRKKLPDGVGIASIGGFYSLTGKDIMRDYVVRI